MTESNRPENEIAAGETATHREDAETHAFRRGAISAFILFNLVAIVCWALPLNFSPLQDVKEITRPYMVWSGLFQSWDFFAPNPKGVNSYIETVVITRDRRQLVWPFPRMQQLGFAKRYEKERYRKFIEGLPEQRNADLWPGVAKHVAHMFQNPADPPQMVLLIEFQSFIEPTRTHGSKPVYKPRIFYEYVADTPSGNAP